MEEKTKPVTKMKTEENTSMKKIQKRKHKGYSKSAQ